MWVEGLVVSKEQVWRKFQADWEWKCGECTGMGSLLVDCLMGITLRSAKLQRVVSCWLVVLQLPQPRSG